MAEIALGRFTRQEQGRIRLLPDQDRHPARCRVESIPLRGAYRYHDICELREEVDGVWLLGDILARDFDHRAVVLYGISSQRDLLGAVYTVVGLPFESKPGPDPEGAGLLYVAFNAPQDPVAIAIGCGVMQPLPVPMPPLEDLISLVERER